MILARLIDCICVVLFVLYIVQKATLEDSVHINSLRRILHIASNITYFEPAGYEIKSIKEQHKAACVNPGDSVVVVQLFAFARYFNLIVHQDVALFHKNLRVVSHSKQHGILHTAISIKEYYTGKVSGDESSYVNVRIHDGIIDGCFYTQDELYHVEPASKHFKQSVPFHSLVYRSSEVHFNSSKLKVMAHQVNHQAHVKPVSPEVIPVKSKMTDANTCALHIAADHHLFKTFAKESLEDTVAEMVFHIAHADKIFRSTDFSGDGGHGDNIGFTIAAITVYQDETAEDVFNPVSSDTMVFLTEWSKLNHEAFCLSLLFTFKDFNDGVLGLAWVGDLYSGGICSKRITSENSTEEISFNSAVATLFNNGARVPRKASIVTVTHELGHSFGASHDPRECRPGGHTGNYIMYERATDGTQPNNYFFSKCSKAEMWPVIYYKGPVCFIAHDRGIYCGNKVVEKGEDCDCGYPEECASIDKCCDPGNMTSGILSCKIKDGYQCSPKKGPCCSDKCQIITADNITCQEETECTYRSICNVNVTCPIPVPKPPNTTCNHGSNTCLDGVCIGSICTKYNLDQCSCTNFESMCHVCCSHKENCVSSSTLTGLVIYQSTGSLCGNMTGYCNEFGQCIIVDTDSQYAMLVEALRRLTSKAMLKRITTWANDNWFVMLLVWCGILIVFLMLKFKLFTVILCTVTRKYAAVQPEPFTTFNNVRHIRSSSPLEATEVDVAFRSTRHRDSQMLGTDFNANIDSIRHPGSPSWGPEADGALTNNLMNNADTSLNVAEDKATFESLKQTDSADCQLMGPKPHSTLNCITDAMNGQKSNHSHLELTKLSTTYNYSEQHFVHQQDNESDIEDTQQSYEANHWTTAPDTQNNNSEQQQTESHLVQVDPNKV